MDDGQPVAQPKHVPRPRRRRVRFAALVIALSLGVQVPALLALVRVTGHTAIPIGLAAALSLPFVGRLLRNPWEHRP